MRGEIKPSPDIPVIENIHQRVLAAVTADPKALDMDTWHRCDTTHCRAGWITTLAGDAGKALELFHDTPLAAFLIYQASSQIRVTFPRFFEDNETAMADMERCAREEAALVAGAPTVSTGEEPSASER